jgi:hypothetical protein
LDESFWEGITLPELTELTPEPPEDIYTGTSVIDDQNNSCLMIYDSKSDREIIILPPQPEQPLTYVLTGTNKSSLFGVNKLRNRGKNRLLNF